ncbi:hypothetical protein RclHR1_00580033 [Rhizophagus clarus]|uniref:Uncharacterized protein n=1 Tax=Rhizophagus clarus TaxID=94130 RepID=A0A2Z6RNS0_9GLOM|nr:hypothetical protein RclHR1_00580033 [Rhizophagus clarus]
MDTQEFIFMRKNLLNHENQEKGVTYYLTIANDHNDEDEEALPSEDSFASAQNLDFTFGQNAKKTHLFESREYDT